MKTMNKVVLLLLSKANILKLSALVILSFLLTVGFIQLSGKQVKSSPTNNPQIILTSPAFAYGRPIPQKYANTTAHPAGTNISPPLAWHDFPVGTNSFALLVIDPDAGNWVHWIIYSIPAMTRQLKENVPKIPLLIDHSKQGLNSHKTIGYEGPTPPKGTGIHHYIFTIYALDTVLSLPAGATRNQFISAIQGHILRQGQLIGTYQYK